MNKRTQAMGRAKEDGFDSKKRWGNSAMRGHGVNSPAMMEARAKFANVIDRKTDGGKKMGKKEHGWGSTMEKWATHPDRLKEHKRARLGEAKTTSYGSMAEKATRAKREHSDSVRRVKDLRKQMGI